MLTDQERFEKESERDYTTEALSIVAGTTALLPERTHLLALWAYYEALLRKQNEAAAIMMYGMRR